jgi:hypothetical protein
MTNAHAVFHVNHPPATACDVSRESFTDTELREDDIEQILDIHGADDPAEPIRGQAQLFGSQFLPVP